MLGCECYAWVTITETLPPFGELQADSASAHEARVGQGYLEVTATAIIDTDTVLPPDADLSTSIVGQLKQDRGRCAVSTIALIATAVIFGAVAQWALWFPVSRTETLVSSTLA